MEQVCQKLLLFLAKEIDSACVDCLSRLLLLLLTRCTSLLQVDAVLLCNFLPCLRTHLTIEANFILLGVLLRVEQATVFLRQVIEPLEENVIFVLSEQLKEGVLIAQKTKGYYKAVLLT